MLKPRSIRRTWFRLLAVGPIVLLLAVAPAFLYIDHWSEMATYAVHGSLHAPGTTSGIPPNGGHAAHHNHCHFGPSGCADHVAPVGNHVLPRVVELPNPELAVFVVYEAISSLEGVTFAPPTDPPQL